MTIKPVLDDQQKKKNNKKQEKIHMNIGSDGHPAKAQSKNNDNNI